MIRKEQIQKQLSLSNLFLILVISLFSCNNIDDKGELNMLVEKEFLVEWKNNTEKLYHSQCNSKNEYRDKYVQDLLLMSFSKRKEAIERIHKEFNVGNFESINVIESFDVNEGIYFLEMIIDKNKSYTASYRGIDDTKWKLSKEKVKGEKYDACVDSDKDRCCISMEENETVIVDLISSISFKEGIIFGDGCMCFHRK